VGSTTKLVRLFPVLAAAAAVGVAPLAHGGSQRRALHFRLVASGLDEPVYVAQPPGQPRNLYVVERSGRIVVLVNGRVRRTPFLDIRRRVESGYTEQGLLSVAFHPNYARNHRFFVCYTNRSGDIQIVAYRAKGLRALVGSARTLLVVRHRANDNHDGGQLQFGPDGLLYAGTGDGGAGGDPPNNSQNLSRKLGKLLRLDVDKAGAKWRIAGYGLRNPWRFSFDRATGDLYIADVGQDEWEEVDVRPRASLDRLANYGWSRFEGREIYDSSRTLRGPGEVVGPVAVYSHRLGCSVTGGYVYRGSAVPAARGRYFYGDYCSGRIWSLRYSGGTASVRRESLNVSGLSSFGEDLRGELYAVSLAGRLYRLAG
jgi:glucose/arabinose dehydrogenase